MACVNDAQAWLTCCILARFVAISRPSTTKGLRTLSGPRAQCQNSMRAEAFKIAPQRVPWTRIIY